MHKNKRKLRMLVLTREEPEATLIVFQLKKGLEELVKGLEVEATQFESLVLANSNIRSSEPYDLLIVHAQVWDGLSRTTIAEAARKNGQVKAVIIHRSEDRANGAIAKVAQVAKEAKIRFARLPSGYNKDDLFVTVASLLGHSAK